MNKHIGWIIILLGAVFLMIAPPAKGQFPSSDSLAQYVKKWVRNTPGESWDRDLNPNLGRQRESSDLVMLKIVLLNKTSVHFYRKGYKRGEQYWYLDGRKIKKLPGNWFVWEWRKINN